MCNNATTFKVKGQDEEMDFQDEEAYFQCCRPTKMPISFQTT